MLLKNSQEDTDAEAERAGPRVLKSHYVGLLRLFVNVYDSFH